MGREGLGRLGFPGVSGTPQPAAKRREAWPQWCRDPGETLTGAVGKRLTQSWGCGWGDFGGQPRSGLLAGAF